MRNHHVLLGLLRKSHNGLDDNYLDRLGGIILGSSEHEGLRDALAAQLVDLNHSAEGDQADKGVRRQQAQGHLGKKQTDIMKSNESY